MLQLSNTNHEFGFLNPLSLVVSGTVHGGGVDSSTSLHLHGRLRYGFTQHVASHHRVRTGVFGTHVEDIQRNVAEIMEQVDTTRLFDVPKQTRTTLLPPGYSIELERGLETDLHDDDTVEIPFDDQIRIVLRLEPDFKVSFLALYDLVGAFHGTEEFGFDAD